MTLWSFDISEDKISLKNKTGVALNNRTFVKVLDFTKSNIYFDDKKIKYKYFFGNLLESSYK